MIGTRCLLLLLSVDLCRAWLWIDGQPPDIATNFFCKFRRANYIYIICEGIQNIGQRVDDLVRHYTNHDLLITLELNGEFPNGILQPKWYNGFERIHQLTIISKNLKIIQTDAFNCSAFHELQELSIRAYSPYEYRNITEGLIRIVTLHLETQRSGARIGRILISLKKTLVHFYFSCTFATTKLGNLNNLFGNVKLSKLKILEVIYLERTEESTGVWLGACNFTGLVVLQEMHLVRCGIMAILVGTFDFIGETLKYINLSGNRLTTLTIDLFLIFLDWNRSPFYVTKWLALLDNPLHCNYEYYRLRNMTLISFGTVFGSEQLMSCIQDTSVIHTYAENSDNDLQFIHANRWHLNHPENDVYSYPNFQLKFDVRTVSLAIKHSQKGRFRLLVIGQYPMYNKLYRRCPNRWIILSTISCVTRQNTTDYLLLTKYLIENELTTFCVIYISVNRQIWPLHCATIRRPFGNESRGYFWSETPIQILLWSVSSVLGVIIGFIIVPFVGVQVHDDVQSYKALRKNSASSDHEEDCRYVYFIENALQDNDYLEVDYYEELRTRADEQVSIGKCQIPNSQEVNAAS